MVKELLTIAYVRDQVRRGVLESNPLKAVKFMLEQFDELNKRYRHIQPMVEYSVERNPVV